MERLKNAFAQFALTIPDTYISPFSPEAADLFGEMYAKKVKYGVSYDDTSEKIIAFVLSLLPTGS